MNGIQSILVSTSLTLEPLSIIRLYSYRFRIECTFRELKQQVGAFCYHFWSKHMPRLNYYQKKEELSPLECVEGEKSRKKNTGSCARHRNAYGTVLYCNGNTTERFHSFCRRVPPRADTLPEDAFQGADVRSRCHALSAETFFPPFRKTARIMHNADNSGTAGWVRNLLGFTGFLSSANFLLTSYIECYCNSILNCNRYFSVFGRRYKIIFSCRIQCYGQ